jgi:phosphate transport system substrate-binding protein
MVAEDMHRSDPKLRIGLFHKKLEEAIGPFKRAELDAFTTSGPLSGDAKAELSGSGIKTVDIPLAMDAVVVAVSPKNTFAKDITKAELVKVWNVGSSNELKWSDVRHGWPAIPVIRALSAADESFIAHVTSVLGTQQLAEAPSLAMNKTSTTAQLLAREQGALGLARYSYAQVNRQKTRMLPVGGIEPTAKTLADGTYPFGLPLTLHATEAALDQRPLLRAFIKDTLDLSQDELSRMGFVQLPARLRQPLQTKTR